MPDANKLLATFTAEGGFTAAHATHLLNRAGFGSLPAEVAKVIELGPDKAVDWLLDFPDAPAEEQFPKDVPDLSSIENYPRSFADRRAMLKSMSPADKQEFTQKLQMANREAVRETAMWWMRRMIAGPHPLQEKLALFWHGHFTTSGRDERSAWLMWQQNELLRRQSAGNFKEFVRAISRDPAMLDYLNNSQNRKAHPNENYARELMELFTLGIGAYTENDVQEAARAFTGWSHDGEDFFLRRNDHDNDPKTLLGRKGNLDGDDVVDILFQQRALPRHIVGRLWSFFCYEEPEPEIIGGLARTFRESKWNLRPVLTQMLRSEAFYSSRAMATQIKSPVQLIVGTARALAVELPPVRQLAGALDQMGQMPLMPPNVKGWPGGRSWINTSTLFARYNACVNLVNQSSPAKTRTASAGADGSPAEVCDFWLNALITRSIDPAKRQTLLETLRGGVNDENAERAMIQLIASMPEYQLC